MGDKQNIIEMNGKKYDAMTGKVIGVANSSAQMQPVSGKAVDGFVRRKGFTPKPVRISSNTPVKAASVHKKTQRSKTLMRSGLKNPAHTQTSKPVQTHNAAPLVAEQNPAKPIDKHRFARAKAITKSSFITRFGTKTQTTDIVPPKDHKQAKKPAKTAVTKAEPSSKALLQQTLHNSLAKANSHLQPPYKPERKRSSLSQRLNISQKALNISLFAISFLAIGSFIAYQNVPNLSMRLAVAKSGVQGSLPGYKPSGFSMSGPIYYQPGQISLAYKSNSDDRAFNIVQKKSSWNNEALLEKYVAASNRAYQTFQEKDKTIYIYDGNNASWINDGVWYEIKGTSALSQDQLIRLANSL